MTIKTRLGMVSRLVLPSGESDLVRAMVLVLCPNYRRVREEKMSKATWKQMREVCYRMTHGTILEWKARAVFGIIERTPLGTFCGLMHAAIGFSPRVTREQVQALIDGNDEALGIFKVTVDYGLTLEQMIRAGKYNEVNPGINEQDFPISGKGKVQRELILVRLNKLVTTDEAFAELDQRNLHPANIEDLLVLGALRPDLQRESVIAALGSCLTVPDQGRGFPCLSWEAFESEREMSLYWGDDFGWREFCCFLAVRKDAA